MKTTPDHVYVVNVKSAPVSVYSMLSDGSRELVATLETPGQHSFIAQSASVEFEGGEVGLVSGPFEFSHAAVAGGMGAAGKDGEDGKDGVDGKSPYVDASGHLFYWDDTAAKWVDAGEIRGEDGKSGKSPYIRDNHVWYYDDERKEWVDGGQITGGGGGGGEGGSEYSLRPAADGTSIVGGRAQTDEANSIYIGTKDYVYYGAGTVSIGANANCNGNKNVCIGEGANSGSENSVTIGYNATNSARDTVSIGHGANGGGVIIGANARSDGSNIVIGKSATSFSSGSIIIGDSAVIAKSYIYNTLIGHGLESHGNLATSIGHGASSYDSGVAVGYNANAYGDYSVAVGSYSVCNYKKSVSIGQASTSGIHSTAIGCASIAKAGGFAIGSNAFSVCPGVGVLNVANGGLNDGNEYFINSARNGWQLSGNVTHVTQLYLLAANSEIALEFSEGQPALGFTVWEKGKGVVRSGCRKLSELLTDPFTPFKFAQDHSYIMADNTEDAKPVIEIPGIKTDNTDQE